MIRWARDRFAIIVAVLVLLYLFLPVAYTFVFSFNNYRKSNIVWNPQGSPTLKHWKDPCGAPGVCEALGVSLRIGVLATVVATVLGTLLAFALVRHKFIGRSTSNVLVFVPMATPEIVLGASLLTIFVQGFSRVGLGLGFWTITIAHIMFCVSFVVVTVKARLQSLDPRIEEAAQDLYAGPGGDVLAGHLPARPARHRRRGAAQLLAVLRRLHHHELRLRQRDDLPEVRLRLVPARDPRPGQRHRLLDVRHRPRPGDPRPGRRQRPPRQQVTPPAAPTTPGRPSVRVLMIGAGGVGDAAARIAADRGFFEAWVVADHDLSRAERTVAAAAARPGDGGRFSAAQVDASDAAAVAALAREVRATHVLNAVDPRFVVPIFEGARAAGADYLDMAMSLSRRHPEEPYAKVGVKLGDEQFAQAGEWEAEGRLALVGIGVEPGLSDVFARYAADHLFSEIDELGTRDGANLVIRDEDGNEVFAPGVLDVDDHRGVPQPARRLGEGPGRRARRRLVHAAGVQRARGLRVPRGHRARSSASTSSTRRCSSCRAGSTRSR